MPVLRRAAALAGILACAAAVPASAQQSQTRQGFWIGFGLGYGSLGFTCDICNDHREGALSGYFKLGGTVNPQVLLGFETNGWTKTISGETLTAANGSFIVYYYPSPTGGLFLRGGLGLATLSTASASESGLGLVLGVGSDVRVGSNMSLTPVFNLNWGEPEDGLTQLVIQAALGLTWH